MKYKVEGGGERYHACQAHRPLSPPLSVKLDHHNTLTCKFVITLPNLLPSTHFSLRHRDHACLAILQSPLSTELLIPIFSH